MYTEEQVQSEKICPQTLTRHSQNGGYGQETFCFGSRCMAWRWADVATLNEQGGSAAEYSGPSRRGYCGLAGATP
jgi:hypothetical protein